MTTMTTCVWTEDALSGAWETACGGVFEVIDGTPAANGMRFCLYCGGRIEAVAATEEEDDDE